MQNKTQNTLLVLQGTKSVFKTLKKKKGITVIIHQAHLVKKVRLKFSWEPLTPTVLSRLNPTHNVNFPVGDKLRPDKAFPDADIAARWCSAPSRNCPQPHVAVLYILPFMITAFHDHTHRILLVAKFWDNLTLLTIHTGLLFPASLSGRGRGQENLNCGCWQVAPSLPPPSHSSLPIYPHIALDTQPSSPPDPLQPR